MKLTDIYPPRFLTGKELQRPVTITVAYAIFEEVRDFRSGEKKQKPVIYAEGAKRGVVVSKTMNGQLVELFGDIEFEALKGKRFTIYPHKHQTGNIMICVKAAADKAAPASGATPSSNGAAAERQGVADDGVIEPAGRNSDSAATQ